MHRRSILKRISDSIRAGLHPVSDRLVARSTKTLRTMDDIAELAGVSKPTVSRALQDSPLVNAKTKEHVLKVAERYGYVVNRNAQNLRRQRNDVIALALDYSALPE